MLSILKNVVIMFNYLISSLFIVFVSYNGLNSGLETKTSFLQSDSLHLHAKHPKEPLSHSQLS